MSRWYYFLLLCFPAFSALAQGSPAPPAPSGGTANQLAAANQEISLSRDSARVFFGTYEFRPNFKLRIFSENGRFFGQRQGDADRFQIFPKQANAFFLKVMSAELEFQKSPAGDYETLILHQGSQDLTAKRIVAQPIELYDTILQLDATMYRAYNERQLPAFTVFLAPNLEFYHDQTGKTDYAENVRRFRENFAKPTVMRRELVPGSLEVYAVAGFGAIEIGTHRFYQTDPGQAERLVAQPRFVQVWQHGARGWQLVRVVSYDH